MSQVSKKEVCVWGVCHVCEKVVTGPQRPPGCLALVGIRGYGRYYCHQVGCPKHPVEDHLCQDHQDFDPDRVVFSCVGLNGVAGVYSATQLGWVKPQ